MERVREADEGEGRGTYERRGKERQMKGDGKMADKGIGEEIRMKGGGERQMKGDRKRDE
jgi:hypothetical protein